MTTTTDLAAAIERAYLPGIRPFRDRWSSNPADQARATMDGTTHYYDADTLRYFHARILSSRIEASGLLHIACETVAADHENKSRVCRYVAHDVFGTAVYHPTLDESPKTREKARKMLDTWLAGFDVVTHTVHALRHRAAQMHRDAEKLESVLAALEGGVA